ncbi:hypothetical protein AAHE18_14G048200 [Arachis hypogaea]
MGEESGSNVIDMEYAQRAALFRDWEDFKKFFANNKRALLKPMDMGLNTPFHVAMALESTRDAKLLKELLEMVGEEERWQALRKANDDGDTLLHVAAASCKELDAVELVLDYEKKVQAPQKISLVELKNEYEETPIFTASKEGNLKMLQHVAKCVGPADLRKHFYRGADKTSILHIAIIGQHFDVAVWLLEVDGSLANEMDDSKFTSLQLLAKMPFVFPSHSQFSTLKSLIYYLLPEYEYQDFDHESIRVLRQGTESSNGIGNGNAHTSVFTRINRAIWKFLAEEWVVINDIWQTKKQHKLVMHLTKVLVPKDYSWQENNIRVTSQRQRTVAVFPIFEVSVRHRLIQKKRDSRQDEKGGPQKVDATSYSPTPLLLAASTGIVEIIEQIIEVHPDAINHVDVKELDVLQVTVRTRQLEIFRFLKTCCGTSMMKKLAGRIGREGRTLLHYVAPMKYKRKHEAGVVYELQEELRWFERVRNITPSYLHMHCNDEMNQTGKELFEMEHDAMLKSAQEWLKQTSQSCSAVAVLVATVVFAAIYQVPGGTDDNGVPKLIGSSVFWFFTIMDVLALGSSLSSVVMFLSILSSPFDMWQFRSSLPRRLSLGFTLLFFALITTMMSFTATILLTISRSLNSKRWSANLLYSVAFIPVTIFALMQFPLYMTFKRAVTQLWDMFKRFVPKRVIKTTRRSGKRRLRSSLAKKFQHS